MRKVIEQVFLQKMLIRRLAKDGQNNFLMQIQLPPSVTQRLLVKAAQITHNSHTTLQERFQPILFQNPGLESYIFVYIKMLHCLQEHRRIICVKIRINVIKKNGLKSPLTSCVRVVRYLSCLDKESLSHSWKQLNLHQKIIQAILSQPMYQHFL